MCKLKVMTIVGTRPEIIKLSRVVAELKEHTDHVLVHTGQNFDYELNGIFYDQLGLQKPQHFLEAAGATAAETIGAVIAKSDDVMRREQPDALLVLGDTNSCLAVIAAKHQQIPIFHMEAGNRCFDDRVPEEVNRRIVDQTSDVNLTYTEHARRYLLAEGLRPERVIKTGSPMREVLRYYMPQIEKSDVLERMELAPREYFVVSAHRANNVDSDEGMRSFVEILNALAARYDWPVIVSTHPRTQKRMEVLGLAADVDKRVRLLKPLGFLDYIQLQKHAFCVVSDSGTLTEECSIVDFPAVTIRQAHERPEGMDEGTLVLCDLKVSRVLQAVTMVSSGFSGHRRVSRLPPDYECDDVSRKVVRIIASYVDYVNRVVWRK